MAEHLAVNQGVVGSSPIASAIYGLLEKRLNSHAFHACIHGFESRIRHQLRNIGLIQTCQSFFFRYNLNFLQYVLSTVRLKRPFFDKNQENNIERSTEIRQRSTEINNGFMEKKPMMRYNQ